MLPLNFESKTNFTNKNILYLFNRTIYEYDIKSAGLNLCIYYKLLPQSKIDSLSKLDKTRLNIKMGNMRKDKEFSEKLKEAFSNIRKEFYDANDIDINDIIAVKKDAIFTTKRCDVTEFENVEFRVKNIYSSFIQLKNLEIYYRGDKCDVKGIDDDMLVLHEEGILTLLKTFFKKMETGSIQDTLSYLNRISSKYKRRELPLEYYREFNANSKYILINSDDTYDEFWEDEKDDLNISFNLINVIIPLVKIAL